jgi:hypothetical protein
VRAAILSRELCKLVCRNADTRQTQETRGGRCQVAVSLQCFALAARIRCSTTSASFPPLNDTTVFAGPYSRSACASVSKALIVAARSASSSTAVIFS